LSRFFLCVFIAMNFHASAILALIYIYIYYRKIKLIDYIVIGNLSILLLLFYDRMFQIISKTGFYIQYFGYESTENILFSGDLTTVLKGTPWFLILILLVVLKNYGIKNDFLLDKVLMTCLIVCIFIVLQLRVYWSFRFSYYFMAPIIWYLPNTLNYFKKSERPLIIFIIYIIPILIILREVAITYVVS
uniref:EpsG family protein n=2 Tax=Enterococcus TaxID=1350 RepID=UPI00035F3503